MVCEEWREERVGDVSLFSGVGSCLGGHPSHWIEKTRGEDFGIWSENGASKLKCPVGCWR